METNDYDCPQYVDFASDYFLSWKGTASPSALHHAERASTEYYDSLISEGLEGEGNSDVSMVEENADLHDVPESFKTSEAQNLNSDALVSGSLSEDEDSNLGKEHFAQYDVPENSETFEGHSYEKVSDVSSCSATCDTSKQETPHDFPLHHANLRASEVNKGAIPKSFNLKNKNYASHLFYKVEQHKLEKEALNVSKSKKRKSENYIPLAEQVAAFQRKTPKRFHTTKKDFEPAEYWAPPTLNPQSPNLHAAKRRRVINVLSTEEKEKLEMEENQKHQFHARPLNSKVFGQPQLPKVPSKPSTKPKNINFNTAQRAAEQYKKKKQEEPKYEFHARPVPAFIAKEPNQLKSEKDKQLTIPVSPCFALKSREEKWSSLAGKTKEIPKSETFKAQPPPTNVPFVVKHEKKATEVQPFSFDVKDKERYTLKKQKIEEEIEKENTIPPFKAQPVPNLQKFDLPEVCKKPVTEPEPFSFSFEKRNSKHSSINLSGHEQCFQFKARPATVLQKPPFVPEKPEKQSLGFKEFNLYTDVRASERQKMKEQKQMEEEEKERALLLLQQEEEERERKEILKLRQELVHKANPVRHYKSIAIQPSSKPLTDPHSPKFATEERLLSKHSNFE